MASNVASRGELDWENRPRVTPKVGEFSMADGPSWGVTKSENRFRLSRNTLSQPAGSLTARAFANIVEKVQSIWTSIIQCWTSFKTWCEVSWDAYQLNKNAQLEAELIGSGQFKKHEEFVLRDRPTVSVAKLTKKPVQLEKAPDPPGVMQAPLSDFSEKSLQEAFLDTQIAKNYLVEFSVVHKARKTSLSESEAKLVINIGTLERVSRSSERRIVFLATKLRDQGFYFENFKDRPCKVMVHSILSQRPQSIWKKPDVSG